MSIVGSQYADKIFSEHPIALWPLDEENYYLSLIDNNDRLFSTWTLSNCTANNNPSIPDAPSPFDSNIYSAIVKNTSGAGLVEAESAGLFSSSNISLEKSTFCVNFFLYQKPTYINWFKVGYRYLDNASVQQEVISDAIPPPATESWINFNNIYLLPTNWQGDLKIFIQINYKNSSGGDASSRTVIMNGLSVGQNSETTCYVSLGGTAINLPESSGLQSLKGIPADQYGTLSDNGYYIVRNNNLLAYNDGFPIIYGTNNSTKISPSGVNLPSFIFPGKGMLHEKGKNKQYTLEIWIKINPSTNIAKKIIGPLSSNNGIYVKEGFLTLVIGNQIASHCVSEWYRPMLIHLLFKENNIIMLLNGEEVINIPFDRSTVEFSNETDWWGIYSYSFVKMFKVDCISIYPYIVSNLVAKRRFVYGQGTPSIQSIDNTFKGTPTTIDFSTSEYSSNIIYPDFGRWDAGYFNNLDATKNYLSVPNYQLPIINLGGRDITEWYKNNYIINTLEYPDGLHPKFITFRPNIEYDENGNPIAWNVNGTNYTEPSYFNFTSLNILNNPLSAIYGIFEIEEDIAEPRTLMSFVNIIDGNKFDINVEGNKIKYLYNENVIVDNYGNEAIETITIGQEILVGLNFELAGIAYGYEISKFFSSPSSIQLYIGGNGTNTFEGKIYIVGFCNQNNYDQISDSFQLNGIINKENYEILVDHIASYTLIAEYEYEQLYLDISISAEWEEYFPLTYFASYVKDENGDPIYELDMLQVNLGYASTETEAVWSYNELKTEFDTQDYQDLKDSVYENYFNLEKNNTTGTTINVKNSSVQGYITFQPLSNENISSLNDFPYEKMIPQNLVIDPDLENTELFPERAYQTKFAFKDNVIVYPPKSKNFEDYSMVVYLEINQRSILKNPLKIKSFEISSKNLNYPLSDGSNLQKNYIGTKFGTKMYPKIDAAGNIDYKGKNPYLIYKQNTPYIYTTEKSGIKLINRGSLLNPTSISEYTVDIPINSNGSYDFNVSAINLFVLTDLPDQEDQIPFLNIRHKNGITSLVLNKGSSQANIVVYDMVAYDKNIYTFIDGGQSNTETFVETWDAEDSLAIATFIVNITAASLDLPPVIQQYTLIEGINFYQNGNYVKTPYFTNNEWTNLAIVFDKSLDFGEFYDGAIQLFGDFVFNNVSYYLQDGLDAKIDLSIRTWDNVLNEDYEGVPVSPENVWAYWSANDNTWQYVYILGQKYSYITTPKNIYQTYTGTNKDIIDDDYGLQLVQKETKIITDASWSSYVNKPA